MLWEWRKGSTSFSLITGRGFESMPRKPSQRWEWRSLVSKLASMPDELERNSTLRLRRVNICVFILNQYNCIQEMLQVYF